MTGGTGTNIFTAGAGADTMTGVGAKNTFDFATTTTTGGAAYVVNNFVGTDTINVTGYTSAQVLANATFSPAATPSSRWAAAPRSPSSASSSPRPITSAGDSA